MSKTWYKTCSSQHNPEPENEELKDVVDFLNRELAGIAFVVPTAIGSLNYRHCDICFSIKEEAEFYTEHDECKSCLHRRLEIRRPKHPKLLSKEQVFMMMKDPCHYCGSTREITLDLLDQRHGYTVMNCVPICSTCQEMKQNAQLNSEQFVQHIKKISDRWKNID